MIYSVCPIFTNPPDWVKTLSNGVKTHLLKFKTTNLPPSPAPPPPVGKKPDWLLQFWDALV